MAGKNRKTLEERGNKLWAGMRMILPEHRAAMWDYDSKQEVKQRPRFDEVRLEEMSRVLAEAIQTGRLLEVTTYNPFGNKSQKIFPKRIDPLSRTLIGLDPGSELKVEIPLFDVLEIRLL